MLLTMLPQLMLLQLALLLATCQVSPAVSSAVQNRPDGLPDFTVAQQKMILSRAEMRLREELREEDNFRSFDVAVSKPGSTTDQHNKFTFTSSKSVMRGREHRLHLLQIQELVEEGNVQKTDIPRLLEKGLGPEITCTSSLPCNSSSSFRTADGSCNNLEHPTWGMATTPMRRWLDQEYDDGISSPREEATAGGVLPSARLVSTTVHIPSTNADRHASYTHMLMQWGQFLDHDITSTPTQQLEVSEDDGLTTSAATPDCCASSQTRPQCFSIEIPENDRHFSDNCMNFVRSVQVENAKCQAAPVEQLNQITAYIDASQVYGSSQEEQNTLRTFVDGKLKTINSHLPKDESDGDECTTPNSPSYCFLAGDHRVNENPTLQSMHTIFMREHNRIAGKLKQLNCQWGDERIFQEARRIVGAMMQVITYDEYLPIILGKEEMHKYGLTLGSGFAYANVYNTTTDASIRSAFATAAFRMGHSMIRSFINSFSPSYTNLGKDKLSESFGNTTLILNVTNRKVDHYIRGLAMDDMQDSDYKLSQEITDNLFADSNGNSMDLAALNIQRGRDHGLPSYTKWRKYCNIPEATPFSGLAYTTHTAKAAGHLKDVYGHIDDIDLFPGALSEKPVPGGMVGPTFTCLLAKQFQALKEGDRFWFEEDNANVKFTQYQLNEIRKASLSRVVCDNTDTYKIQKNAFIKGSPVWCSTLDEINLTHWRETQPLGLWTTWQTWSGCDGGQQTRTRSCSTCSCIGQSAEKKSCNLNPCDEGSWGPWSECRRGKRSRHCSCTNGCSRRRRSSNQVDHEDEAAAMFAHPLFGEEESMTVTACLCSGLATQDMACV
ncbi:salivary peroxidase/catechol oxidase-like [Haliotis cracherodii]|uniref:salivary peroxidase/catechol oxidase-like n=1 Tax=Haliotis cracherodii TaxID=6455 RepID=UPI0039EA7A63